MSKIEKGHEQNLCYMKIMELVSDLALLPDALAAFFHGVWPGTSG